MLDPMWMKTPAISVSRNRSGRKTPEDAQATHVPKMTGTIAPVRNGALISASQIRILDGRSGVSSVGEFIVFTRLPNSKTHARKGLPLVRYLQ